MRISDTARPKLCLLDVSLACEVKVARFIRNSSQIISGRPLQVGVKNRYRGLRILTTIFSEFTQKRNCFLQTTSTGSVNKFKELKRGNVPFVVLLFFCFVEFNSIFNIGLSFWLKKKLCSRKSYLEVLLACFYVKEMWKICCKTNIQT